METSKTAITNEGKTEDMGCRTEETEEGTGAVQEEQIDEGIEKANEQPKSMSERLEDVIEQEVIISGVTEGMLVHKNWMTEELEWEEEVEQDTYQLTEWEHTVISEEEGEKEVQREEEMNIEDGTMSTEEEGEYAGRKGITFEQIERIKETRLWRGESIQEEEESKEWIGIVRTKDNQGTSHNKKRRRKGETNRITTTAKKRLEIFFEER